MDFVSISILTMYYFALFSTFFWLLVFFDNRHKMFKDPKPGKKLPSVSIIIPAYNEEKTIEKTIISCLNLNYPKDKLEIIVVNDGSTDKTRKIAEKYAKRNLIKLINKPNTGKADSLNVGISVAKGELVMCLDADSEIEPNALFFMVGYFKNKKVAAVSPSMKVKNAKNIIQKIQFIEYAFSNYLRKLFSFLDCVYVTPGPGSVYRKNVIKKIGGFDKTNITEDMEIALRLQKNGYKIKNSLNAITYTEAPSTFFGLLKQRLRWYGGYFENILFKHRDLLFNKVSPHLTFFLLPSNFLWVYFLVFALVWSIYTFLYPIYKTLLNYFIIGFDITPFLHKITFPKIYLSDFVNFYLFFFIISYIFSILIVFISMKLSKEKINFKKRWSFYLSYFFLYFMLLSLFYTLSLFYVIWRRLTKKSGVAWKK